MYIHVSSKDSVGYYPNNKPSLFRLKLNSRLDLQGPWELGVCDLVINNVDVAASMRDGGSTFSIACDICSGYIINGIQTRVLRTIPIQRNYQKTYPIIFYHPVETYSLDTIEFRMVNNRSQEPIFNRTTSRTNRHKKGNDEDTKKDDAKAESEDMSEDMSEVGCVSMTLHLKHRL